MNEPIRELKNYILVGMEYIKAALQQHLRSLDSTLDAQPNISPLF